ncbi:MAG: hypothetical protein Q9187_004877, partial [Circinaria calcarea]
VLLFVANQLYLGLAAPVVTLTIDAPHSISTGDFSRGRALNWYHIPRAHLTYYTATSNNIDGTIAGELEDTPETSTTKLSRDLAVADTADSTDTESDSSAATVYELLCIYSQYSCAGAPYREGATVPMFCNKRNCVFDTRHMLLFHMFTVSRTTLETRKDDEK